MSTYLFFAVGFVPLITVANILVGSAIIIAKNFGTSQPLIGLTLVVLGISLPGLATPVTWEIQEAINHSR